MGWRCLSLVLFVTTFVCSFATEDETTCSKFNYDKQMLETMVRLEAKMNQWDRERKIFEENMLSVLEHRREEMDRKYEEQKERLDNKLEEYKTILKNLTVNTSHLEQKIEGFSVQTTPKVAFNAYAASGGSFAANSLLVFQNVILNEGGGYDNNTGFFTAPMAGLYLFSVHICHVQAKYVVPAIMHEDMIIAVTTGFDNDGYTCNSVMAPVIMEKGGRVHVKCTYASDMYADKEYRWPSFNGVLLNI